MYRSKTLREKCFTIVFVLIASPCIAQLDIDGWLESSSWTDSTGKHQIEATFVRLDQQNVILKKSDGKEVSVPLSKLNEASRKRAMEASKKKAPAAAAAPTKSSTSPSPGSPNAPKSSGSIAIPKNLDAKQYVDFLMQQAKEDRLIVFWDALPDKYQKDVDRVVKLAAEKVDPTLVKPVLNITNDLVKVLRTKKSFVLNTPMVKSALQDERLANTCYDPMVDLVEAYLPNELLDQEQLKSGSLRPLLEKYLIRLAQKARDLESAVPKDSPAYAMVKSANWDSVRYEVKSATSDSATLVLNRENSPEQKVDLVKVDDRWLPKQLVEGWDQNMEKATQELGKLTPQMMAQAKQSMQGVMMVVGGALAGFQQANDQQSFDQALAGVMSMIPMGGGMPFPGMQIPVP